MRVCAVWRDQPCRERIKLALKYCTGRNDESWKFGRILYYVQEETIEQVKAHEED